MQKGISQKVGEVLFGKADLGDSDTVMKQTNLIIAASISDAARY